MINVDQISQGDYRYHFPTIDFKFQNVGTATAFLWQFNINVLQAEIDLTPAIDFEGYVDGDNVLQIAIINNSWGGVRDCEIQIDELSERNDSKQMINLLFPQMVRQYKGTFQSGESRKIIFLRKENADQDIFYKFLGKKAKPFRLGPLMAIWRCQDDNGNIHTGNSLVNIRYNSDYGNTYLTQKGFGVNEYWVANMLLPSFTTYITIIDPLKSTHVRTYPISRKIPPGDVERFHIMIGSPMSCHILTQFEFLIDERASIKSETFDMKIWNPKNSLWHEKYADGTELERGVEKEMNKIKDRDAALAYFQEEIGNYPFLER